MNRFFVLAVITVVNPTLLAAVTVIFSLRRTRALLLGYLAGATLTSVTCSLLIVVTLHGSGAASTSKQTVNPIINLTLGLLILACVIVVATGRDKRRRAWSQRRRERNKDKPPPRWRRWLSKGTARTTFAVGVVLSFPGASQIAAMDILSKQHLGAGLTVISVLAFSAIMLVPLELPLAGYAVAPTWTESTVRRFTGWLSRRGGRVALVVAAVVATAMIVRGIVNW